MSAAGEPQVGQVWQAVAQLRLRCPTGMKAALEGGALPLALLRIVVAGLILTLPALHTAPGMAALPPLHIRAGSAWLVPCIDPTGAAVAWWGVVLGALLGGAGVATGPAFSAVTLCGAYLLLIPQLQGGIQHVHHLLWFSALLAALVPPRGQHTVRYHGVLAPASPRRRKVVARPRPVGVRRRTWIPWDQLVLRTFGHDPLRCPQRDARMRQRAIVRSSAGDVLVWLEEHAKALLVGPPPRDGPSDA